MKVILVPALIILLAQTSWPFSIFVSKFKLANDQFSIVIIGSICMTMAALGPFLVFRCHISSKVDPLMYVFSVFAWTCMLGLGIALEVDGYISDFMGYYLAKGERYMLTAHCTAINYWDGFVHFPLYIVAIGLYAARKSHREVGLFWVGSLLNSVIVLIPGAVTGNHPFNLSILLNIPYVLSPLLAAFKFLNERPPQWKYSKHPPILKRPVDFMFVVYFIVAIGVAAFRGLTVLGSGARTMQYYIKNIEPYMFDPSNFPRTQILVYKHFFLAYYLSAIYGLVYPGKHWMTDWSLIHAGAAAQAQFSYTMGSVHRLTPVPLRAPMTGMHGLFFWTVNVTLAVVPQLFAWRCLSRQQMFGQAHNIDRAELKQQSDTDQSAKKLQ